MNELLKIPGCTSDKASQLRFVYDKISINIQGLDSLGVPEFQSVREFIDPSNNVQITARRSSTSPPKYLTRSLAEVRSVRSYSTGRRGEREWRRREYKHQCQENEADTNENAFFRRTYRQQWLLCDLPVMEITRNAFIVVVFIFLLRVNALVTGRGGENLQKWKTKLYKSR